GGFGAATLALNPLHAMFPERSQHFSPYSPSHRQFLALHYLDIEAVADFADCAEARLMVAEPGFRDCIESLRRAGLVDYAGVSAAKRPVLGPLCAACRAGPLARRDSPRAVEFRDYQRRRGAALGEFSLCQALSESFRDRP